MKKGIIGICLFAVLAAGGIATAADELGVDLSVSWVSKYIWRGIDLLDDKAAVQPSVNIDLWGTGFYANVWASYAGSSKGNGSISTVDATEYDYTVGYANTAYQGEAYQMDYAINYVYYDFIDAPSIAADAQEINVGVAMPNICPFGTVPSYTVIKMWNAKGGSPSNDLSGWIHYFRVDYALSVPGFIDNNPEQVIDLFWDITYNDGAGAVGVDQDWSHTTFGMTTDLTLADNLGTITPGLFYQISMDDTVNTENELWTGVTYSVSF